MPLALTPTATIPANDPPPSMVRDLSIVTTPKPPGSRTSISPPGLVFALAPAKVLHGLVRLQGLTSSPTAETQVRFTVAPITQRGARKKPRRAAHLGIQLCLFIMTILFVLMRTLIIRKSIARQLPVWARLIVAVGFLCLPRASLLIRSA